MPKYLILINYTEKGISSMKDSPQRIKAVASAVEEAGGKLESFHLTLGQYDAVSMVNMPDDVSLAKLLVSTAAQGYVRTSTMRAFSGEEFEEIVGG